MMSGNVIRNELQLSTRESSIVRDDSTRQNSFIGAKIDVGSPPPWRLFKLSAQRLTCAIIIVVSGCERQNEPTSQLSKESPQGESAEQRPLSARANEVLRGNWSTLSTSGGITENSPLRTIFSLHPNERASQLSVGFVDRLEVSVHSDETGRLIGLLYISKATGKVEGAYDADGLKIHQSMEVEVTKVLRNMREALAVFASGTVVQNSETMRDRQRDLLSALLLPADLSVEIRMSPPRGTNSGEGLLRVIATPEGRDPEIICNVFFPIADSSDPTLNFPKSRPCLLSLEKGWARLNTMGYGLDKHGIPVGQESSKK